MSIDRAAIEMVLLREFWRMAIIWPLTLLYCYARLNLEALFRRRPPPRQHFRRCLVPDSAGGDFKRPICIITGATSGLGSAAARALAGEGYHVVLGEKLRIAYIRYLYFKHLFCTKSVLKWMEKVKQDFVLH